MHPAKRAPQMSAAILLVMAVVVCATGVISVAAQPVVVLSGAQQVPPVKTRASGRSTIVIHDDRSVTGGVVTSGMHAAMAHIHLGTAGTNGPAIVALRKVSANHFEVPAGTRLTEAEYKSFKAGGLYVNVHSTTHDGGEIRAQLEP
jgi:CHRD domain